MSQGVLTMGKDFQARWLGDSSDETAEAERDPLSGMPAPARVCMGARFPSKLEHSVPVPALLPPQLLCSSWLFCPTPVG